MNKITVRKTEFITCFIRTFMHIFPGLAGKMYTNSAYLNNSTLANTITKIFAVYFVHSNTQYWAVSPSDYRKNIDK